MDKYYTPSIEEFHVGFEYEYWDKSPCFLPKTKEEEWTKRVFSNSSSYETSEFEDIDEFLIPKSQVRVKCLDKEDIESLGFQLYQNLADDYEFEWHIIEGNTDIGMFYEGNELLDDPNIEFYETQYYIKNKSELKRLLKQLNIHFGK